MKKLLAFAAAALLAFTAQAGPVVIGTDFTAVPTNALMHDGRTANGENGKGGYLTVYCTGCGTLSDYGPTGTNHLYMRDALNNTHEVAAYMDLLVTPFANAGMSSGTFPNVMGLRVQVGQLDGAAYGTPLNIDLVVNGIHATKNRTTGSSPKLYYGFLVAGNAPNKRTGFAGDYEALTFTPIQGDVLYVDPVAGSDSAFGDINHPLQHLQTTTGAAGSGGALYSNTCSGGVYPNCGASDEVGTPPGTQVVLRGGNYPTIGNTSTGNFARWAAFFRITGDAPGSSVGTGPITITSRPTELAVLDQSSGYTVTQAAGGFIGNDTARAQEINPYDGSTGWDHYIEMSWLKVIANPVGPRDGAPFNLAYGADDNRVSAMDAQWQDTQDDNGPNGAHCAAVCGDGQHVRIFLNLLHNVANGPNTGANQDQNHGVYLDSGCCESTLDATVAFNAIFNITGGNSINVNASGGSGGSLGYMKNIFIHNNWMQSTHKANVCFNGARTTYVWNNVLLEAGVSAIDVANGSAMTANGLQVFHNSIANWDINAAGRFAFWDQGGDSTTGADYRNNITERGTGTPGLNSGAWDSIDGMSALGIFTNNFWWDVTGGITQPIPEATACGVGIFGACGSGGSNSDPLLSTVNYSTHTYDLTLGTGSPAIDFSAAETGIVPREWDFIFKPMAGTAWDVGAYEHQ